MKKIDTLILVLTVVAFAVPAFAGSIITSKIPFVNMSAASGAVKTSTAYNVGGSKYKTVMVSGVTLTSSVASTAFQNMSGTLIAECAPSSSGPWSTCKQSQSTAGADVSFTSNGVLSWQDVVNWIRLKWTAATTGHKIKAWFNWSD